MVFFYKNKNIGLRAVALCIPTKNTAIFREISGEMFAWTFGICEISPKFSSIFPVFYTNKNIDLYSAALHFTKKAPCVFGNFRGTFLRVVSVFETSRISEKLFMHKLSEMIFNMLLYLFLEKLRIHFLTRVITLQAAYKLQQY